MCSPKYFVDSGHHPPQSSTTIRELDFFSGERSKTATGGEETPNHHHVHANTDLNLCTAHGDQSAADGRSSAFPTAKKSSKRTVEEVEANLELLEEENKWLREELKQERAKCRTLKMQAMQQQNQGNDQLKVVYGTIEDMKNTDEEAITVPIRQLMKHVPPHSLAAAAAAAASFEDNVENEVQSHCVSRKATEGESGSSSRSINEQAEETLMSKARVALRVHSEAPMIPDGCQWRKYGQKMSKGNRFPRAYFKCTLAPNCPVRKQVQRWADDASLLTITYEGKHNHQLPPGAMKMAAATSSAMSMLLSGSTTTSKPERQIDPASFTRTIPSCSGVATISPSTSFPTVLLDLTRGSNALPSLRPPPAQFINGAGGMLLGQSQTESKSVGLQMPKDGFWPPHTAPATLPATVADKMSAITAAIARDPNVAMAISANVSQFISKNHHVLNGEGEMAPREESRPK